MSLRRKTRLRADPKKTKEWKERSRKNNSLRSHSRLSRNTRLGHNPERRAKNHERAYGGGDRVRWVKSLECLVPSCSLPAENAHLPGAGGMGYKGDADTVVNLCKKHHRGSYRASLHDLGSVRAFNESWGVDLEQAAKDLDERWKQKQSSD